MKYSEMVKRAIASGKVSEEDMWQSVARVDGLLDKMERENPSEFWKFMRESHEDMYGPHYNREYAEYDLSKLRYTDASGNQRIGAHWTEEQVVSATANKQFPERTTTCDRWVAYNVMYSDLCKKFSDGEILDIAYVFFFSDEDAPEGKIWRYMNAMRM